MPIVSFWSNTKKETAQTLSMLAIASHMAVENNTKILIVDMNPNDRTIQNAFFQEKDSATQRAIRQLNGGKMELGSGIEGLSKLIASGKNSGEMITDYSRVIFTGRLEAILSHISNNPVDHERIRSTYKDLVRLANQQYDYVFVDVPKGIGDPIVEEVLGVSDVIVFNITQRQLDIEDYVALKKGNPIFNTNKVMPLVGRYDRFSKYNKKNIARDIGEKKEIPAVSYNTLFFESANEGELGPFFLKFRKSLISSTDRNMGFVEEVASTAQRLVYKVKEVEMMR